MKNLLICVTLLCAIACNADPCPFPWEATLVDSATNVTIVTSRSGLDVQLTALQAEEVMQKAENLLFRRCAAPSWCDDYDLDVLNEEVMVTVTDDVRLFSSLLGAQSSIGVSDSFDATEYYSGYVLNSAFYECAYGGMENQTDGVMFVFLAGNATVRAFAHEVIHLAFYQPVTGIIARYTHDDEFLSLEQELLAELEN